MFEENIQWMKKYDKQGFDSFCDRLKLRAYKNEYPIKEWECRYAIYREPGKIEYTSGWEKIQINETWNGDTVYFKSKIDLPLQFFDREVYLWFDNEGECLLYLNGEPYHGLDPGRKLVKICNQGKSGVSYEFVVESCPKWQMRVHYNHRGIEYPVHVFKKASLICIDKEIIDFVTLIHCIYEQYSAANNEHFYKLILMVMTKIKLNDNDEKLKESIKSLTNELLSALSFGKPSKTGYAITAIGHSHLDVGYLWPVKETVRKCARTFSNMISLLKDNMDFKYAQSQSLLYSFTKQYYPSLYEKIKQYIKEDRWEVIGGMWVEPDINIPSGESLIRQFVYGKQFIKREFGNDVDTAWLPDTFGYSAILPQIMKKCGFKYFFTAKINANRYNTFPYGMFQWQGLDGSRILSVISSMGGYSGTMELPELINGIERHKSKGTDTHKELLYPVGYGDGGGGTTEEMLKRTVAYNNIPGIPEIRFDTIKNFFKSAEKGAENLPIWAGELYFELHQGTLTSQAKLKYLNRKSELLFRDAEIISVLAGNIEEEDNEILHKGWKLILQNQFHDILPGTSINEVIENTYKEYDRILSIGKKVRNKYLNKVIEQCFNGEGISKDKKLIAVFNTLSFEREDLVVLKPEESSNYNCVLEVSSGKKMERIRLNNGGLMFSTGLVPPLGYKAFILLFEDETENSRKNESTLIKNEIDNYVLENDYLIIELEHSTGNITRIYDKKFEREVVKGNANYFEFFDEIYNYYESWDISQETLKNVRQCTAAITSEITENNSMAGEIIIKRNYEKTTITQTIKLSKNSRRIDIKNEIDWNEEQTMLKASIDANIFSTKATYDIGYGNIERSTTMNTSWERAMHEVPCHKWADISENSYGIALLNDCKYGYDIKFNKLRLTLLRSPKYPDEACDMGKHTFTYSIYPHDGDWRAGNVDKEAYKLNVPLIINPIEGLMPSHAQKSFIELNSQGVYIEAMKYAEDRSGDYIIRVFENHGATKNCKIKFNIPDIHRIAECDMLENSVHDLNLNRSSLDLKLSPYEIKTLRVILN